MRVLFSIALMTFVPSMLLGSAARAEEAGDVKAPAYRVGSGVIRVALLPARCTRDHAADLCSAIDESLTVEQSRDPRIDVVAPRDLELLLGAQEVLALQTCDGDDCYEGVQMQLGGAYLTAVVISRIGDDALITARLIDMQRARVLDRDDARVASGNERKIDEATRALVQGLLVRRGIGTALTVQQGPDDKGSPGIFYAGAGMTGLGALGLVAGGVLGGVAMFDLGVLQASSNVDRDTFNQKSASIRGLALGGDIALASGATLVVAGTIMMIAGSL